MFDSFEQVPRNFRNNLGFVDVPVNAFRLTDAFDVPPVRFDFLEQSLRYQFIKKQGIHRTAQCVAFTA